MSSFNGSIAQSNVQFPIETVIEPIAGKNFSKALIFMNVVNAAEYLPGVSNPAAGQKIELDSSSYGTIAGGLLKTWLVPFFTAATAAKLAVVLYDEDTTQEVDDGNGGTTTVTTEATAPLSAVYEAFKFYAYFKFGIAPAEDYVNLQYQLAGLCLTDPQYSQLWVGTSDTNVLAKTSLLISSLNDAGADARVIYNPDANINPALAQLGATLATVNATGSPVGNDTDSNAFGTIAASGSTDADGEVLNLTATEKAALDDQRIGYQTWVGDGTENVVTEGSMTLKGNVVGAQWVKSYIEHLCKVKTANYITQKNKFRNNEQYQAILLILSDIVQQFVAIDRLAAFQITAPIFSSLAKSADAIIVPNAWQADYIDRIRSVTVYGTLYVTQPTK